MDKKELENLYGELYRFEVEHPTAANRRVLRAARGLLLGPIFEADVAERKPTNDNPKPKGK